MLLPVQVVVRGRVCNVVGFAGMNLHMVNITSVPDAAVRPSLSLKAALASARGNAKMLHRVGVFLHMPCVGLQAF